MGEGLVEKLKAAGVGTVESLADMTPEQLEAIEGIGPKTVEKISIAVNNYFASLEGGVAGAAGETEGSEETPAGEAPAEPAGEAAVPASEAETGEFPAVQESSEAPVEESAEDKQS